MAGTKEIRTKITSIKNTQKITKAMEMVAASKMRKAQDRMRATRPYSERIRRVIGHLRLANPDFKHPFLLEREAQAVGFIVVSTDRGLCGGLNVNLFKAALASMREWQGKGCSVHLSLIGQGSAIFPASEECRNIGYGDPSRRPPACDRPDRYRQGDAGYVREGKMDRLYVVNNVFVNTMTQKPTVKQLLPVVTEDEDKLQKMWDYIYEPAAAELLEGLLMRYIESLVYQGSVENVRAKWQREWSP